MIRKIIISITLLSTTAFSAQGQIKMGNNPTTITPGSTLDIESSSNSHTVILQSNGNIGINTTIPNSTLSVNGSVAAAVISVSGDYTLTETDYTVIYTGGATPPTFILPDPASCKGRMYRLINGSSSSNYQNITLSRPVTLYSGNTSTTLQINTFAPGGSNAGIADPVIGNSALIQSDGTVWWRIGL